MAKKYDESTVQSLDALAHIRLRSGMYIGRLGDGSHPDDGIYVMLKEVIDNAIDEFIMGNGQKVMIELSEKTSTVSVRDYGRGIPLGKVIECVSQINTGAKYNDDVFQFSVGLNGVGTKAVNALSSHFTVKSIRDGEFVEASFSKGILKDKKKGLGKLGKRISKNAKELLIRLSGGDARIMLNALEISASSYKQKEIDEKIIQDVFQTKSAGLYDKKAEEHYNIISAFIKSMRGSDTDAALYYMARILENGEDPKFIARRMIIFAAEDIGMADRGALIQADEAFEAVHKVGMPEAQLILSYVVIYLSQAPKSRAVANALGKAKEAVYEFPNEAVPLHLRNAPTKLMKNLGYAKNYTWGEKYVGPKTALPFLPKKIAGRKFYEK